MHLYHITTLAACMTATTVCYAQETWGGLRFGMTEIQVRSALKSRKLKLLGLEEQPSTKSLYSIVAVRETSVEGFDGSAIPLFDKTSRRLSKIDLLLKLENTDSINKALAYTSLKESLVKKYGAPASSTGCEKADADAALVIYSCTMLFRSSGQSVSMTATISVTEGIPLFIGVFYAPIAGVKGL
jgi:hypothetical protein